MPSSPAAHRGKGALAGGGRRALHPARVVDDALLPGSIISGRFRLQQLLGRGGMASVWQAFHLALDSEVAIKFLDPRWSGSDEIRSRFAHEATAIARVRSPHVVQVLDYGFTESQRGFIVMELLQGEDLGRRLARCGKLDRTETIAVVSQACQGLGKAHAAQLIHRDIKPENLFLVRDEPGFFVKLLDFGVAKAVGFGNATHQTDTGQIVGTPLYMSPEQALGRAIDVRCDLYSLATVAYRCLTGRPPFVEKHVGELLVAISTRVPPPPSSFDSTLPRSLDAWFASMFSKDANARCCQTVRELATTFEGACNGIAPLVATLGSMTAVSAEAPTLPGDPDGRAEKSGLGQDRTPSVGVERAPGDGVRARVGRLWPAVILAGALAGLIELGVSAQRVPDAVRAAPATIALPLQRPAPRTISVRFAARPETAVLFIDGQPLASNPITLAADFDTGQHHLHAEASGHLAVDREVAFDQDVQLELTLTPTPAPTPLATVPARIAPTKPNVKTQRADASPASPARARTLAPPRTGAATSPEPPARNRSSLELDRSSPWSQR